MTFPAEFESSHWWKFTRYAIRDGYIGPAPGAELVPYDPWDMHRVALSGAEPNPAYKDLISLIERIRLREEPGWRGNEYCVVEKKGRKIEVLPRAGVALIPVWVLWDRFKRPPSGPRRLPMLALNDVDLPDATLNSLRRAAPLADGAHDLITRWCDRHGLLGILPHEVESIALAPRFILEDDTKRGKAMRTTYERTGGCWTWTIEYVDIRPSRMRRKDKGAWLGPHEHDPSEIVPRTLWKNRCAPFVARRGFEGNLFGQTRLETEPLKRRWARFFPSIPEHETETYQYPIPGSASFWQIYSEPVEEFLRAAVAVACTIESMGASEQEEAEEDAKEDWTKMSREKVHTRVAELLAPVGLSVSFDEAGNPFEEWNFPSLLSCLMRQALQDLTAGFFLTRCASEKCGKVLCVLTARMHELM